MECYVCKSLSGKKRISPGSVIHTGKYWIVEHAYPSALKGWMVIVLKRHAEALHELTKKEFVELAEISEKLIKRLHKILKCEKEYSMCLAEKEHFYHIHVHIVPKPYNLSKELKGAKIFEMLKVSEKDAVPNQEIRELCEKLKF